MLSAGARKGSENGSGSGRGGLHLRSWTQTQGPRSSRGVRRPDSRESGKGAGGRLQAGSQEGR
ncbi:MAG: hypothetical protein VR70_05875 [Rhodospirillaceae bacterium BRH_c57]|nr:MAG: hypothetical protein VR70_05875 [Rhodospirillaceae bacterium BRH_c57]